MTDDELSKQLELAAKTTVCEVVENKPLSPFQRAEVRAIIEEEFARRLLPIGMRWPVSTMFDDADA